MSSSALLSRYRDFERAIREEEYFKDMGHIELSDDSTLVEIKIKVIPREGFHAGIEYILTLLFHAEDEWPFVYIDSPLFDKIKTDRYLQKKGKNGTHQGVCIKKIGYGYAFRKNFRELCNNQWKNYLFHLIVFFNDMRDFEKGNGIRTDYKKILSI